MSDRDSLPASRTSPILAFVVRAAPLLLVALASLALAPSLAFIAMDWVDSHSAQSHGPLVVPVVLWLVWRQRTPSIVLRSPTLLFASIACLTAGLVVASGHLSTIEGITAIAWPIGLLACLLGIYGASGVRRYMVPVGVLYFALPVWGPLRNAVLWPLTVWATPKVLQLTGVAFHAQGRFISVKGGVFEIEAACSGSSFVMVAMLLATLLAHLWELPRRQFLSLVGQATALAFFANLFRVVVIILIGDASDMRNSLVRDHYFFGWCIFATFFAAFLWWARRTYESAEMPRLLQPPVQQSEPARLLLSSTILLCALALGPLLAVRADHKSTQLVAKNGDHLSKSVGGAPLTRFDTGNPIQPRFPGANVELFRKFGMDGEPAWVYINAFVNQRLGRELISDESELLDRNADTTLLVEAKPGRRGTVERLPAFRVRMTDGSTWIVRNGYFVGGALYQSELTSRLAMSAGLATGITPLSGIIAISMHCNRSDCADGVDRAIEVSNPIVESLQLALDQFAIQGSLESDTAQR